MPITGSRYLVVGGAGKIGSSVAQGLAGAGASVIVADTITTDACDRWAELPSGLDDFWALDELQTRLERHWRDIAAIGVFSSDTSLQSALLTQPRRLWDVASQRQRPFFFGSSLQVYGSAPISSRLGADPATFRPATPLGQAARVFERFAHVHQADADAPPVVTALRADTCWQIDGALPGHVYSSLAGEGSSGAEMARIMLDALQGPFEISPAVIATARAG
jgi:nucleoside-diphosphate-sugar epimerase